MLIACKCLNLVANANSTDSIIKNHEQQQNFEKNDSQLFGIISEDLQKLQKSNVRIYGECMKFFRQSSGPLNGLQENIIQKDLICKVSINPWILYYCINCETITHAKHTSNETSTYLINTTLLTNQEELSCLKTHQSYSNAFDILIIDRSIKNLNDNSSSTNILNKLKQNRYKNLKDILNNRLQKEIYETDERIRRYTEQQFALLKMFREKSEQEYQILVSLINQVPDDIKIIDAIDNNLIGNSSSSTTTIEHNINKTTTITASEVAIDENEMIENSEKLPSSSSSELNPDIQQQNTSTVSLLSLKQQQILNLDTPPATPDSTPMSVGNSPTFRQQTINLFNGNDRKSTTNYSAFGMLMMMSNNGSGDNNTDIIEPSTDADCLFELEGMEVAPDGNSSEINTTAMSDLDETEDGEDALGELESSSFVQIPRSNMEKSNVINVAKSLPISITSVPERRFYINDLDDEIPEDTTVDIAASIKALAKSVHGDTVFGDLPRPRFSTQI